jgi:hypothetical protein
MLLAQPVLSPTGSSNFVRPGQSITIGQKFTDSVPPSGVTALQWTLGIPSSLTGVTLSPSVVSPGAPTDTVYCGSTNLVCLVTGMTQTSFVSGVVATTTLTVPLGTPVGTYPLTLPIDGTTGITLGVLGANALGNAVIFSAGLPFSLTVLSKYDLNGDGTVNDGDVLLWINQILVVGTCTPLFDVNVDGKCNVQDLALVVAAANGKIPL